MTGRLYYSNSMLSSCKSIVTECKYDEEKKLYKIQLDKTVFFPEGGGQLSDTGTIDNIKITDVQEDKDGSIYHYGDGSLEQGKEVFCSIDFHKRFDRMQQHTAEHIISGIVHSIYGYENVGFHLGDEITTLDFSGELTKEDIKLIESKANEVIWSGVLVEAYIPSKEELDKLEYRSKKAIEGDVRIVRIPGTDICACCAPHLENTALVGMVKITDSMRHRQGMRLTILAGKRALLDYGKKHDDIKTISALLSLKPDEVANGVHKLLEDNKGLRDRAIKEQEKQMDNQISEKAGKDIILLFGEDLNKVVIKHSLEKALNAAHKIAAVFSGDDENGYSYAIESKDTDIRFISRIFQEKFESRGGGKPSRINGTVHAVKEQISDIFDGIEL